MKEYFRTVAAAVFFGLPVGFLAGCVAQPSWQEQNQANREAALATCIDTGCNVLDINGMAMEDYGQLALLTHVTDLMMSRTGLASLSDLATMDQLVGLHISGTDITSLEGIDSFPNLRLLHAQYLPGVDLSPLARLNRLEELAVGGSDFLGLSFVAEMRGLERLNVVYGTRVQDLSPLANHPNLQRLDLDVGCDVDLSPLLSIPNLAGIHLYTACGVSEAQEAVLTALRDRDVEVTQAAQVVVC